MKRRWLNRVLLSLNGTLNLNILPLTMNEAWWGSVRTVCVWLGHSNMVTIFWSYSFCCCLWFLLLDITVIFFSLQQTTRGLQVLGLNKLMFGTIHDHGPMAWYCQHHASRSWSHQTMRYNATWPGWFFLYKSRLPASHPTPRRLEHVTLLSHCNEWPLVAWYSCSTFNIALAASLLSFLLVLL